MTPINKLVAFILLLLWYAPLEIAHANEITEILKIDFKGPIWSKMVVRQLFCLKYTWKNIFWRKKIVPTYLGDFTVVQHHHIFDFFKKRCTNCAIKKKSRDKTQKNNFHVKIKSRAFFFMCMSSLYDTYSNFCDELLLGRKFWFRPNR